MGEGEQLSVIAYLQAGPGHLSSGVPARLTAGSRSAIIAIRGVTMASITIRKLEEAVKKRLRLRAAQHGTSMEDEARRILRAAVADQEAKAPDLAQAIRRRFGPLGGLELQLPPRQPMREPPEPGR